ncbi:MAG: hemW [Flaviaesturariibacter sp.]|nr:hemW [Flaviaesturariibacter sp.]
MRSMVSSSRLTGPSSIHFLNLFVAGLYLHIPFCRQACHYCNFHFSTSLRYKDDMVEAMAVELAQEAPYLQKEPLQTIYFGGGTPSLLDDAEAARLFEAIHRHYTISPGAEITLEANPDDITVARVTAWKALGVNRLSIGTQSFFEDELRWMNRAHTAAHAKDCINLSLAAGIDNLSIDLIYGSPLLSDEGWRQNVETALAFGIPHLSCYALTVEEKTPLHKHVATKRSLPTDDEKQARQFLLLMDWMQEAGYEHYEVSNFAKPGFRSRHNSAYWKGEPYLGIGPSAHSFNGRERRWNVANNAQYIAGITDGTAARETEQLTASNRLNEALMIGLRTSEGLDLAKLEADWGEAERKRLERALRGFIEAGLVRLFPDHAQLTKEGMLRADGIAAALFVG